MDAAGASSDVRGISDPTSTLNTQNTQGVILQI
jgi:hypothetical protein